MLDVALVHDLDRLNFILRGCSRLESFTLRARSFFSIAEQYLACQNYLWEWSPASLVESLRMTGLRELVIDTRGSELQEKPESEHLCALGLLRLPSLRSLWTRARTICREILDIHPTDKTAPAVPPTFDTIIINLSLKEPDRQSEEHSERCFGIYCSVGLSYQLKLAAGVVLKVAPNVKMMRIITHELPSLQTVAYDCVTRQEIELNDDDAERNWAAEGKVRSDKDELSAP